MAESGEKSAVAAIDDLVFQRTSRANLAAEMDSYYQARDIREAAEARQAKENIHKLKLDGPDFLDKEAARIYDSDLPIFCLFSVEGSDDVWAISRPSEGRHASEGTGDIFSIVKLVRRTQYTDVLLAAQNKGRHLRKLQHPSAKHIEENGVIPGLVADPDSERVMKKGDTNMMVSCQIGEAMSYKGINVNLQVDEANNSLQLSADGKTTLHVYANRQARQNTQTEPKS